MKLIKEKQSVSLNSTSVQQKACNTIRFDFQLNSSPTALGYFGFCRLSIFKFMFRRAPRLPILCWLIEHSTVLGDEDEAPHRRKSFSSSLSAPNRLRADGKSAYKRKNRWRRLEQSHILQLKEWHSDCMQWGRKGEDGENSISWLFFSFFRFHPKSE